MINSNIYDDKVYNLNSLIDKLVAEVKVSEFGKDSIAKAELSITLTLIYMAVKSIPRTLKLFNFTEKLEEIIFDEKRISSLNLGNQMELFDLSLNTMKGHIHFVTAVLNSVKWQKLESALTILSTSAVTTIDASSRQRAEEILSVIQSLPLEAKTTGTERKSVDAVDAIIENDIGEE